MVALQDFERCWTAYSVGQDDNDKRVPKGRALEFMKQTSSGIPGMVWDQKKAEHFLEAVKPEEEDAYSKQEFAFVVGRATKNYFGGRLQLSKSMT